MKIAIGIPTVGRAELIKKMIDRFDLQSRKADAIFICPASDDDVKSIDFDDHNIIRVDSDKGTSKQRNAILRSVIDFDVVVFFDDDFLAHEDYIRNIESEFADNSETVIVTGNVIADGACNAGIPFDNALEAVAGFTEPRNTREEFFSAYGCNMAIRLSVLFSSQILFDEALPFYSWLEDLDFSTRIKKYGKSIKISSSYGVHMGSKKGKTSGVRYGYSQVANPLHIAKKGNGFTYVMAIKVFTRNIIANSVKSILPEPYIDRFGRLKGNAIAIKDLFIGRLDPRKIEGIL